MRAIKYILISFCFFSHFVGMTQQPFTAGNIVVYRVGAGTAALTTATAPVFLDEYTQDGTLVQSIAMPTVASGSNSALTARGLGGGRFEGMMNLSADGKFLVVPGMNAAPGGTTSAAAVLGLVDFNGNVNTSTAVSDFTENNNIPFSAISDNGTRFWFGGFGAIRYALLGSTSSVQVHSTTGNVYDFSIWGGQLFAGCTAVPASINKVGSGLPTTTGQSLTSLPGLPLSLLPMQFEFADMDPATPGADVLYIADQGTPGGISKFSLVNGNWVSNGNVGVGTNNYANLTLSVSNNSVTVFATRQGSNSNGVRGGELVKLVDNSGYNSSITGLTPVVLASVSTANTMAFRGVALVPQPAPFTPGNIVVYRVGSGTSVLTTAAAPVFLDEYSTTGTMVQSIRMPVAANGNNKILTARGLGGGRFEGMMNLSADGRYLILPGINASIGSTTSTGAVIGVVDYNAKINTTTSVTDFTENSNIPFGAISDDGTRLWFGGFGGIRYTTTGSSTSILINGNSGNNYDYSIANGQLYVGSTSSPASIYKVGNGLPTTSAQTLSALPGLPLSLNPMQFEFADLDLNVAGPDVLYIADQGTPGGILKFSLVNGTWVANGNVGAGTNNYANLTLRIANGAVTIFATRQGPNSNGVRGGELVMLVDNSGYNGMLAGTPTVIVSAATPNTVAFRGVAKVPLGCPSISGLRVPDIASTQATVRWDPPANGSGNYEYAVTSTANPPTSGTSTSATSVGIANLTNATTYYVHLRTVCSPSSVSEWVTKSFVTGCQPPPSPLLAISINPMGLATALWSKVFGASGYEYAVSASAIPPASGTAISDTSVSLSGLNSITQYYLHVRSSCGGGNFSAWTTKSFSTSCFTPVPSVSTVAKNAGFTWNKISNAVSYEYGLTYGADNPLSGNITKDTFYLSGKISEATAYYFHVRSVCSNGSVSQWNTVHFNTVGLAIYPNPVKDVLTIQLNGSINSSSEVTVGDAMGRVVVRLKLNNSTATINTRGWAPGIYLVRYDDGKNKYAERIVKQ